MSSVARRRAPKRKTVSCGELTGTGSTLTEAKLDLRSRMEAALSGPYGPVLITHGGYTALLYRDARFGWEYRLYDASRPLVTDGVTHVIGCSCPGHVSREHAIQSAAGHLVNLDSTDYHEREELPAFLTDKDEQDNVLTCRRFQRAYRWSEQNNPGSDFNHHQYACFNTHDERFA